MSNPISILGFWFKDKETASHEISMQVVWGPPFRGYCPTLYPRVFWSVPWSLSHQWLSLSISFLNSPLNFRSLSLTAYQVLLWNSLYAYLCHHGQLWAPYLSSEAILVVFILSNFITFHPHSFLNRNLSHSRPLSLTIFIYSSSIHSIPFYHSLLSSLKPSCLCLPLVESK